MTFGPVHDHLHVRAWHIIPEEVWSMTIFKENPPNLPYFQTFVFFQGGVNVRCEHVVFKSIGIVLQFPMIFPLIHMHNISETQMSGRLMGLPEFVWHIHIGFFIPDFLGWILSLRRQRQRFRTTGRWWLTFLLLHTTSCEDDVRTPLVCWVFWASTGGASPQKNRLEFSSPCTSSGENTQGFPSFKRHGPMCCCCELAWWDKEPGSRKWLTSLVGLIQSMMGFAAC